MMSGRDIPPLSIGPDETHTWVFDLGSLDSDTHFWDSYLSKDEIYHSEHYKFAADRLHFTARRGLLRQLICRYTSLDPDEINYQVNPYGKLSLIAHPLSFNLSHSQNRVVFVFTLEKAVGVDIEQVRPLPDFSHLVEYWFSSEERSNLLALDPALYLEAFYQVWTQKEAYLKAQGEGLSLSLKNFSVSTDPNEPGKLLSLRNASDNASHWKMINYIPEAGWRVAVCVHSETEIRATWHTPDLVEFLP